MAPWFLYSFVFGLTVDLCIHPQKVFENSFSPFKSHVFLLKILAVSASKTEREKAVGEVPLHPVLGLWAACWPTQHRDWVASGAPGSIAAIPFSGLGEARLVGGWLPP